MLLFELCNRYKGTLICSSTKSLFSGLSACFESDSCGFIIVPPSPGKRGFQVTFVFWTKGQTTSPDNRTSCRKVVRVSAISVNESNFPIYKVHPSVLPFLSVIEKLFMQKMGISSSFTFINPAIVGGISSSFSISIY